MIEPDSSMPTARRVIYDFGANNGDDIGYYLQKADLVVAVEANPKLAEAICNRFSDAISAQRLVVECCVLTTDRGSAPVDFYVHRTNHVLSQFPKPASVAEFSCTKLPSRNIG